MGIVFKIALTNVFWEYGGEDTRYFSTLEEQKTYFDNLIGGNLSPLFNFQINDSLSTVVYFKDTTGRNIIESLRCNYAIVIAYDEETNEELTRKYYFAKVYQDSNIQLRVELELDDIQTNYIQFRNQIVPCFINRATLNRFKIEDNKIKFNCDIDSPLFAPEKIYSNTKRLEKRTKLNFNLCQGNSVFNNWYNENIMGWEYIYLSPKETYEILDFQNFDNQYSASFLPISQKIDKNSISFANPEELETNFVKGSCICICVPIYKTNSNGEFANVMRFTSNNKTVTISNFGLQKFLEMNNLNSYVFARKFSILPPFVSQELLEFTYNEALNSVIINATSSYNIHYMNLLSGKFIVATGKSNDGEITGCLVLSQQLPYDLLSEEYTLQNKLEFTKSEIVGVDKNILLNPKLLNEEFSSLKICVGSQNFEYSPLKLGKQKLVLNYSEPLTPDITKCYVRVHNTNGIYINDCENNYTGLVVSNDNSLMVANDQLQQMLANNKNFFIQQILNLGQSFYNSPAQGFLNTFDTILGLQNLEQAPDQLRNANGNVNFSLLVSNLQPYIEETGLINNDKEYINDYMFKFGFSYGRIGNIEDFANTRKYFDYISADVDLITAPISNDEKYRLKQRLKSVRFWHTDTIQYDLENYEKYLEELIDG